MKVKEVKSALCREQQERGRAVPTPLHSIPCDFPGLCIALVTSVVPET